MSPVLDRIRQARRGARDRSELAELIGDCHQLLGERGEANGMMIAQRAIGRVARLSPESLQSFFAALASEFDPDADELLRLATRYARTHSPDDLVKLSRCAEPARQELMRRLNRAPGGAAAIVSMRAALLQALPENPGLRALDADILHLLTSWFSPGFLKLERVDWNSPAQLLEKLIHYEAVHEIDGWTDLRRRLAPDRRCFAFFHPVLPDEPLIFVEVALLRKMPGAIAPLLDRRGQPDENSDGYRVAVFYSISNCQAGLRGVNLGNFLIKQVALQLQQEFGKLKTFCTLSPVPGFMSWLRNLDVIESDSLKPTQVQGLNDALQMVRGGCDNNFDTLIGIQPPVAVPVEESDESGIPRRRRDDVAEARGGPDGNESGEDPGTVTDETRGSLGGRTGLVARLPGRNSPRERQPDARDLALRRLCAHYLLNGSSGGRSRIDPVANFHLNNGASLERINLNADQSPRGRSQSLQMMVNYCYDLQTIEANHQRFVNGEVVASRVVRALI